MTASWLTAAAQIRAREPNIPPQQLMLDAFHVTTVPVYLGRAWDLHRVYTILRHS